MHSKYKDYINTRFIYLKLAAHVVSTNENFDLYQLDTPNCIGRSDNTPGLCTNLVKFLLLRMCMFFIQSIDPGLTFISETSAHHLNQSKNRYPNIVPCKCTNLCVKTLLSVLCNIAYSLFR